ncbi:MAG TPA: STAS domain-containing protein [Candidatus Polarisedimenticolaceae bacterium]|nr:STAS domain-containing protein [Candidatus Polarisedimenticolaceae bacterium]
MLKISRGEGRKDEVLLKMEGALSGSWVAEVRTTCDELLGGGGRIALDLRGVTYVDLAGSELLGSLRDDSRVEIESASAFVVELLKGGAA